VSSEKIYRLDAVTESNLIAAELIDAEPPRTRASWATERLRDALLFGDIAPGEELRETHLARAWGVSVTPLREALRQLASEGLVELQPQRVARAAPLSREHTAEVYALRLALEPAALRLSMVNRADDWDLETIAALEAIRAAQFTHPVERRGLEREHRRFHLSLVADCGSGRLLETLSTLWNHSVRARYLATAGASVADMYDLHRTLYESCRDGDLDGATAAMDAHLRYPLERIFTAEEVEEIFRLRRELSHLPPQLPARDDKLRRQRRTAPRP
jgi:GntR family transcriptional regulator, carbon starvation induced regulator